MLLNTIYWSLWKFSTHIATTGLGGIFTGHVIPCVERKKRNLLNISYNGNDGYFLFTIFIPVILCI